jgi:hypothetical protein
MHTDRLLSFYPGRDSICLVFETSETKRFSFDRHAHFPAVVGPGPIYPTITTGIVGLRSGIKKIKTMLYNAQIVSLIVKLIAIDMVDYPNGGTAHDDAVHVLDPAVFSANPKQPVCATSRVLMPIKLAQKLIIGIVNQCKVFLSTTKGDIFHLTTLGATSC